MDPALYCKIDVEPGEVNVIELIGWIQRVGVNLRQRSDGKDRLTIHVPKLTPNDVWYTKVANHRLSLVQVNPPTDPVDYSTLPPVMVYFPESMLASRRPLVEIGKPATQPHPRIQRR